MVVSPASEVLAMGMCGGRDCVIAFGGFRMLLSFLKLIARAMGWLLSLFPTALNIPAWKMDVLRGGISLISNI
jgi:hypothetical protein